METITEHLAPYIHQNGVNAFVVDSIPNEASNNYRDKTFREYHYQTNRFNKMRPGDLIIYRVPAKYTKDHQFYFLGGGVIDRIEPVPHTYHEVIAYIKEPFKLKDNITQDDVLDFDWPHKKRENTSYLRFWNQYGMNTVGIDSFVKLLKDEPWISAANLDSNTTSRVVPEEEAEEISVPASPQSYTLLDEPDPGSRSKRASKRKATFIKPVKVDFSKINEAKKTIGDLGEALVVSYLENDPDFSDVEHVAVTQGDGLGYDITAKKNGEEVYIEVKSTSSNGKDGFIMSDREEQVGKNLKDKYFVYRIYNLNPKKMTFNLHIFQDPVNDQSLTKRAIASKYNFK